MGIRDGKVGSIERGSTRLLLHCSAVSRCILGCLLLRKASLASFRFACGSPMLKLEGLVQNSSSSSAWQIGRREDVVHAIDSARPVQAPASPGLVTCMRECRTCRGF